jgi:hypothetical protein
MRIILCRVNQKEDGCLYIERNFEASSSDDYIAISHVWGDPSTIQAMNVEGMNEPVSLSPGKLSILDILRRPDVCGNDWFWMDLFSLDQTPNAPISMANQLASIPTIYKCSRYVKVLLESPVCTEFRQLALRGVASGADEDSLNQFELDHARKCSSMPFMDAWFQRLWTRQEGLYGTRLQTVVLNPIDCPRLYTTVENRQKWINEGVATNQQYAVQTFVRDKLEYHGHVNPGDLHSFRAYLDLVYRGDLDMKDYPSPFPGSRYSPIDKAWRSGRETTKPRDYVLAVFPDLEGYTVPANARDLSFAHLIKDAIQQLPQLKFLAKLVVKLTRGTLDARKSNDSCILPFIPQAPLNITEAYDTFSIIPRWTDTRPTKQNEHCDTLHCDGENLGVVAENITLTPLPFTRENLQELINLWETSVDTVHQVSISPLSGPCLAANRIINSDEALCHRAFAIQFGESPIRKWATDMESKPRFKHGVINPSALSAIGEADYELYLTRFMICLMCGITLKNAMAISDAVEFRRISTPQGDTFFALINKSCLKDYVQEKFVLLRRDMVEIEGFHVGVKLNNDSCTIVGRTWIPKNM